MLCEPSFGQTDFTLMNAALSIDIFLAVFYAQIGAKCRGSKLSLMVKDFSGENYYAFPFPQNLR